jgi:hypothetical protein
MFSRHSIFRLGRQANIMLLQICIEGFLGRVGTYVKEEVQVKENITDQVAFYNCSEKIF